MTVIDEGCYCAFSHLPLVVSSHADSCAGFAQGLQDLCFHPHKMEAGGVLFAALKAFKMDI